GPKATISFTYCMARLESKVGGAAVSDELSAEVATDVVGAGSAEVAAAAFFCLEQASEGRSKIKPRTVESLRGPLFRPFGANSTRMLPRPCGLGCILAPLRGLIRNRNDATSLMPFASPPGPCVGLGARTRRCRCSLHIAPT